MTRSELLSTVDDVIDALGGPSAMAEIFGGSSSRFSNYKLRGFFPKAMHMEIYVQCMKRGLTIAPLLVGMDAEVARRLSIKPLDRQFALPELTAD